MFLFSLLAKAVDKVDEGNRALVEQRFARKGCSKEDLMSKIEKAKAATEKAREKCRVVQS